MRSGMQAVRSRPIVLRDLSCMIRLQQNDLNLRRILLMLWRRAGMIYQQRPDKTFSKALQCVALGLPEPSQAPRFQPKRFPAATNVSCCIVIQMDGAPSAKGSGWYARPDSTRLVRALLYETVNPRLRNSTWCLAITLRGLYHLVPLLHDEMAQCAHTLQAKHGITMGTREQCSHVLCLL